ncbi:uncharacterized protein LAESUDRAFT_742775 [Laetiporus sulphureus 93-53]|uniref:Myb-like domain-containing protein n=1 Tax=Laetiporus sulphureus 93-53 TaxID=1314785 RepID=A0A165ESA4_9APHY|nr:uncharacterized protein LAESUDRAFT_742775 [Laetiporus sulphureus 93-53]KZT07660.1 hypothetical protein LAESUDRAFT_742775 [Laetiporus sulphureus 93-53]
MDNPQYYQPLSHALHPLPSSHQSQQQQYASYASHAQSTVPNGAAHTQREEEEEEEEDDEEIVEEELDHHDPDRQRASNQSSPRSTVQSQAPSAGLAATTTNPIINKPGGTTQDAANQSATDVDESGKRKPGRPRGSRNRKPRASAGTVTKAPANSQHPGFYQYPPAPSGAVSQNQQFYEFQWRALNLCSEFYNAAEELVKAASPVVIAQCYQMGPSTKIDPLAMIADAKRVCDNLLANPSQLVGSPPPPVYSMPSYPQMPPPPSATTSAGNSTNPSAVITNPQSFVMSLGSMPPPSHAPPQPYYASPMYPTAAARYPTTPYYSYPSQPYYTPPPQPAAQPAQITPTPSSTPTTGSVSTFNAVTGSAAPGGTSGAWSEEETERLRRLAEQSREMGGAQNKGEIEWDWVVQQWGNSRTRHQILLKATSMGLKESTTRGTKRRRETDAGAGENHEHTTAPASHATATPGTATGGASAPAPAPAPAPPSTPAAPATSAGSIPSANASPAMPPQRPPSSSQQPTTIAPSRTTTTSSPAASNLPWPMPTVAANTPSPVISSSQIEQRSNYYRPRPTQTASYAASASTNTTTYAASAASATNTAAYGAPPTNSRPTSSHGGVAATHQYMYRPNGAPTSGRRDGSDGSRSTPYESASAVNYQASHIYPNSVVPYGSSSLSGANVLPPTQVIYPPSQSQSRSQPGTPSTSPAAAGKRKETEDGSHNPAPRKRRPPSLPNGDDPDVGPNGGPKHWTDSEKTSLFNWLLLHDNHWDMFRTKMNTVFRDASAQIFGGRKSFTALKSCYHRNVETFKQIFAFEVYLSRLPPDPNNPADGNAPFSDRIHDPTMARQAYLEQKLEEARGAGVPVANLNMKVIDHWHQKGWYNLFKSRFREDPRTGLPIPSYGPSSLSFPAEGSSNQMLYPPSAIDPQLTNSNADEEEEEEEEDVEQQVQETLMSPMHNNHPGPSTSAAQSDSQIPPNPTGRDAPLPPTPILPQKASQPHSSTRRTVAPSLAPDLRTEQMHLQMMQAMDRFTAVTNSLMDQCATLSQLLVAEAEERKIRAQAQSERVGKKEDGLNRKEKATLATEMLANADVGDEVRKAAADYLKRLFMSE